MNVTYGVSETSESLEMEAKPWIEKTVNHTSLVFSVPWKTRGKVERGSAILEKVGFKKKKIEM